MEWPPDQRILGPARLEELVARCRDPFLADCRAMRIDNDLLPLLTSLYLPLAAWLRARRGDTVPVVGVCGAQGSGKSTFCRLLATVLAEAFGEIVATLSIDDIYETRERRRELARDIHPLFATRGVPGTHEVALGIETIGRLRTLAAGEEMALPAFDKAMDTRRAPGEWPRVRGPVATILFEGWCVGAAPQSDAALEAPVNRLERDEDPDGTWRRAVNERLTGDYRTLFGLIDVLILLRVDGMHRVFEWRRLQEHKLAAEAGTAGTRIMSDEEVDRFIMHYERLTRHILAEMPARADVVFDLDETHAPARVLVNEPVRESL